MRKPATRFTIERPFYIRFTLDWMTRAGFSSLVSWSMRKMTWLLAVSMIGMLCSLDGQEPTPVSSSVRAVTVYPDRGLKGVSR